MLNFKTKYKTLMALLIVGLSLGGCSSTHTYVNTFRTQAPEFSSGQYGTVVVAPINETQAASLEFEFYRSTLAAHLSKVGFTVVTADQQNADYEAQLNYQIVEKEVDKPFDYHTYFGTAYDRHLGANVVVMDRYTKTEFVRSLSVILKNKATQQRMYEVTGVSRGGCGVMSVVVDQMLTAMFKNFPAQNGSLEKITVKGATRC